MTYYLAIDIGASSGRHILSWYEDGQIRMKEIYRFENKIIRKNGRLCWNVEYLFGEIINGMKKCSEEGTIPVSVGVDTWGVDYALLDKDDKLIGDVYAYRDSRTVGADESVYKIITEENLYARTGIQKQIFNTIYQLMADKEKEPDRLTAAKTLLMVPDFFHFLLTGVKAGEYTNASTTQLLSPKTCEWDYELINALGFPADIFPKIKQPGSRLGKLLPKIKEAVGFDCDVVIPCTHDTASAVAAVPADCDMPLYISSGTWSLMGTELKKADCSEESRLHNFTNEGGYDRRYRYLKNIMGLWMIQSVRREYNCEYSFAQLCDMAIENDDFSSLVDVNDNRFLAPDSMVEAIKEYCAETNQQVPENAGQLAAVIYNSLARCYSVTVKEIEGITGEHFDSIYVVGGGSNADYLNQLTTKYTHKTVYAGPGEATAIGNIIVQMMHDGVFESLMAARECVGRSFDIKKYEAE